MVLTTVEGEQANKTPKDNNTHLQWQRIEQQKSENKKNI